jgi:hypothetical protein
MPQEDFKQKANMADDDAAMQATLTRKSKEYSAQSTLDGERQGGLGHSKVSIIARM